MSALTTCPVQGGGGGGYGVPGEEGVGGDLDEGVARLAAGAAITAMRSPQCDSLALCGRRRRPALPAALRRLGW